MKNSKILVFLVLLVTFIIWSNAFIAISVLKQKLTTFQLIELRFIPVGIISMLIVGLFYRKQFIEMMRNHYLRLIVAGLLAVISYNLLLYYGMSYINANAGSLLISLNPLFTLVLAAQLLKESFTLRRAIGTLMAFAGLVVVVLLGKVGLTETALIPLDKLHFALVIVLAALSWAMYTVVVKPLTIKYSPVALNYVTLSLGCLPLYLGINRNLMEKAISLNLTEIFWLTFLSIGCTIVGFSLWLIGVKHWKASNVSLFVFLNPPLTVIFSFIFFRQKISLFFLVGGLVMLMGIIIAVSKKSRRQIKMGLRKQRFVIDP